MSTNPVYQPRKTLRSVPATSHPGMPLSQQVEYLRALQNLEGLVVTNPTPTGVATSPFATGLYREK